MKTFQEQYETQIAPQLQKIDIFLKTEQSPYGLEEIERLLGISTQEILEIMVKEKLTVLDKTTFFRIMQKGSSAICRLFQRELYCGIPQYYTVENISYIYDLDIFVVLQAAKELGIVEFPKESIKLLFQKIPAQEVYQKQS